jgi:hypothetical protein
MCMAASQQYSGACREGRVPCTAPCGFGLRRVHQNCSPMGPLRRDGEDASSRPPTGIIEEAEEVMKGRPGTRAFAVPPCWLVHAYVANRGGLFGEHRRRRGKERRNAPVWKPTAPWRRSSWPGQLPGADRSSVAHHDLRAITSVSRHLVLDQRCDFRQ